MEHGPVLEPQAVTANPHADPGDFVAEQARSHKANPNYIGVFILLGVLTAIEVTITTLFPQTIGRIPILLFMTVAKGLLVVLFYMHLRFDSRIYAIFFGAGIFALALPFVLALVFLLSPPTLKSVRAGEANGGQPQTSRPAANPNAGPPVTLNLDGTEFAYKPDALAANSGQAVNIVLTNSGSVEHTFVIASKPKNDLPEPWATNDGTVVAKAQPGGKGRGGFIAPAASGDYVFYCNVPGHAAAGMHGTFTVK